MLQVRAIWIATTGLVCCTAVSHAADTASVRLAAGNFAARSDVLRASGGGWFMACGAASHRHPALEWGGEFAAQFAHYDTLHYVVGRFIRPASHLMRVSGALLGSVRAGPPSTAVWPYVYGGAGLMLTSLEFSGSTFGFPGTIDRERRVSVCGALGAGIDLRAGEHWAIGAEVRRWWTTHAEFGPLTPRSMDLGGVTAAVTFRLMPKPRGVRKPPAPEPASAPAPATPPSAPPADESRERHAAAASRS